MALAASACFVQHYMIIYRRVTMRKALAAITVIALTISLTSAFAAGGPYTVDAKGNCHDSSGKMAQKALCAASAHTYKLDAKGACHDETGAFAKKAMCKA
jgi:hypothetical protein